MPAANVFGYAFISHYASQCHERESLLASIRDEMAAIKRDKRGLYYEAALRLICLWPAFLRWSLNRKWAFATAVFTNVGTSFDRMPLPTCDGRTVAGNLVLDIGAGAGPIRPGTRVSFAAFIYAGRLAIGTPLRPTVVDPVAAEGAARCLCQQPQGYNRPGIVNTAGSQCAPTELVSGD